MLRLKVYNHWISPSPGNNKSYRNVLTMRLPVSAVSTANTSSRPPGILNAIKRRPTTVTSAANAKKSMLSRYVHLRCGASNLFFHLGFAVFLVAVCGSRFIAVTSPHEVATRESAVWAMMSVIAALVSSYCPICLAEQRFGDQREITAVTWKLCASFCKGGFVAQTP